MRRDIKIDEIRALVALVDTGTLMRAAAVVGRTESALSLQLKRLEESAGVALLQKQGRKLVLTEAGKIVLEHGRKLLAAQNELRSLAGGSNTASGNTNFDYLNRLAIATPMRVSVTAEGRFQEMRPIPSFKDSLGGNLLGAVYEYWIARSQRNESIDFAVVGALADRCAPNYILAVVHLGTGSPLEVSAMRHALGNDLNLENTDVIARSYSKIASLLSHAHKIEMPLLWAGACILESYQTHCARTLALPLRSGTQSCDTLMLVSEVSMTERYVCSQSSDDIRIAAEVVQVSTDAYTLPPVYPFARNRHAAQGSEKLTVSCAA